MTLLFVIGRVRDHEQETNGMKVTVTYVTGQAPNLHWSRLRLMSDEEIQAFNNQFFRRETKEFDWESEMSRK